MIRSFGRVLVAGALLAAGGARAGTLVTPQLPIEPSGGDRALCVVTNGGRVPIGPLTITIRRYDGTVVETLDVPAVQAGVSALLVSDGGEIMTASTVGCVVDGKGVSKRTPVSLCRLPGATYECTASVQAP